MTALPYQQIHGSDLAPDITVISIGAPGTGPPAGVNPSEDKHLRLEFDDVQEATVRNQPPVPEHVEQIIEHARAHTGPLVCHCHAGVSRSTAADIIGKCARGMDPEDAYRRMLQESPHPWHTQPHEGMLEMGEEQLGLVEGALRKINDRSAEFKQELFG